MSNSSEEKFDVFLSYRREGGVETARHLYDLLTRDGYSVSFDLDTLRNGRFDTALLSRIDECVDFVIVLNKGCFDRTLDSSFPPENDWLRQELAYAIKKGKNIVPIMLAGFDKFPEDLPDDVREVAKMNGPEYSQGYFDSFYGKLKSFLKSKQVSEKVLPSADVVFSSSPGSVRIFVTVPARNKSFVGREDELVKLKSICESGYIPLITGPGGVGKTELAYEFAHRHKEEYPGGCFLVPMEQALTWQDAFRFMLDVPAPECTTVGEWLTEGTKWADKAKTIIPGMVPELLSVKAKQGKVLLILDNVENSNLIDNVGLGDAFVYGWPRNIHAIATMRHLTREFAEEDTVKVFPLENLGEKAALKLINAKCPPRGSVELDAARELVEFLDYHAWSVELVASEIALTYKRGGSYRKKLSSFKNDPTLMAHGRALRKSTESNAIDLLQPTLRRIKEDEINGELLIVLAQVAALFPANGVSSWVLAHLWDEMFPSVSQEMPFETVFSILRDYAIFRHEDASAPEMSWTGMGGVRRDVSMHRFTRGALQVSLGDKKTALIKEVCLVLLDYLSIDGWIDLADDSELFTWCPFEKFGNDDVVTLLTRHPECASRFDVDALPKMHRARLFARRPELVGEHSLRDLGSGALWFIAANQPKLISRINLELLTPEDWSFLLSFQPQCATLCDMTRLSARDWCRLLRYRPAFAGRCNFKCFNEANWTDLIEERPEFSEMVDLESFDSSNVRRILTLQPKLATRTLMRRLDWQDLEKIFCRDINSIDVYGSDNIGTQQWLSLIDSADFDDAGIAHLCDVINLRKFSPNDFCTLAELCFSKVYDKKYTFGERQVKFLGMLKFVEGFAEESFNSFSHNQKVRLAAIFPSLFSKMNQGELNGHDRILESWLNVDISGDLDCSDFDKSNWLSLLLFRPDFAEKCDFACFTSDDWAILLSHDLSFVKCCDFTRLDGAFWRIFSIGRFTFSELIEKCPQILYEYDFSKVDIFLEKILDGSFEDVQYDLGYEYDLFTRRYTQNRLIWWYKDRGDLQFSRYEKRCVMPDVQFYRLMRREEIYTRVCECLGPSFPEKFDFSLITDRRAIGVIAKALGQRDDELSLLENVDWTLVGDYARDAWREYSTTARKLLDSTPSHDPQAEACLPRRWKGWARDYGEDEHCFKTFSPQEGSRIRQIAWDACR